MGISIVKFILGIISAVGLFSLVEQPEWLPKVWYDGSEYKPGKRSPADPKNKETPKELDQYL